MIVDAANAAVNLGINHEEFLKALTKPRVRVGTEWVNKGQNLEQVDPFSYPGKTKSSGQLGRLWSCQGYLRPHVQMAHLPL